MRWRSRAKRGFSSPIGRLGMRMAPDFAGGLLPARAGRRRFQFGLADGKVESVRLDMISEVEMRRTAGTDAAGRRGALVLASSNKNTDSDVERSMHG